MVGVPRSKGCRTCVQRKVRCDMSKPFCQNCIKGNRECPGFGKGVKFQDEGPRLREKFNWSKSSHPLSEGESSRQLVHQTPHRDKAPTPAIVPFVWKGKDLEASCIHKHTILGCVEGKTEAYLNLDVTEASLAFLTSDDSFFYEQTPDCTTPTRSPVLFNILDSPSLTQAQLLQEFSHSIAPNQETFIPPAMRNQSQWMNSLPELTGTDALLDTTVRAVTLVHIGRLHNSEIFINESRPYYGKALRLLGDCITDKEKGFRNKTLCSTILLSYYEMFASSDDAAWVRHAGGAGTLMRMRGPARHRHGFDRQIFLAYRHTLIIEAFQHNEPCFLDTPEWRELSNQIHDDIRLSNLIPPDRAEIFQNTEAFYQHLAKITRSASDAHHLTKRATEVGIDIDAFRLRTIAKIKEEREELKQIHLSFTTALARVGRLPTSHRVDDPVIPINYEYSNVFISSSYAGFRTTLTICNLNLLRLGLEVANDPVISRAELTEYLAENREVSLDSCRSTNSMLQSSFLGPFFAVFALRLASQIFQYGEPEWDWIIAKLFEIGDRHLLMAKYIPWYYRRDGDPAALEAAIERSRSHVRTSNVEPR